MAAGRKGYDGGPLVRVSDRTKQLETGGERCGFFQRGVCGIATKHVGGVPVCAYHENVVERIERVALATGTVGRF